MTFCKPCLARQRQTEATRTMNGEPWCKWCFGGCNVPGEFDPEQYSKRPKVETVAQCKNLCGKRITKHSKSGLCSECSRRDWNKLRAVMPRVTVSCKKPGCPGRARARSKYGYCQGCLTRDYELRARFYPSQSKQRCIDRAMKRYWARKAESVPEARA